MTNAPSENAPNTGDAGPQSPEDRLNALSARPVVARQGEAPGWPRTRGNVWMLDQAPDGSLRYLSDCYGGRIIGYEEIGGIALAQTPPLALAMIAIGGQGGIARPLPERFEWHAIEAEASGDIHGRGPADATRSHAVAALKLAEAKGEALRTVAAVCAAQSSMLAQDAALDGTTVTGCLNRLRITTQALVQRGKTVFADRIAMSLLDGAPETSQRVASAHYARTAQMLVEKTAQITGQASAPLIVVSQSTTGEVALAEGRLDIDHPAQGFVVASPRHPFPPDPAHPALLLPHTRMLVDELEAHAVATVQNGARWYCPRLRQAWQQGDRIVAEFSALSDLVSDGLPHGFGFTGCTTPPTITNITLRGKTALIDIQGPIDGPDVFLTYAWSPDGPATGSLRDSWSARSLMVPHEALRRHALACRTRIMPSDLEAPK
jgi:hypothetical protein